MAKRARSGGSSAPPRQRQHSFIWLQGLLCGALATLATPTALLLGVLLAPAIAAMVLDHQPGRPRARSIVLCGMAASVDPLQTLWTSGHNLATATALLGDPQVLGTAWSAAAVGWLLVETAPLAVRAILEALSTARASRLQAERERLIEAWGLPSSTPTRAEPE
jgi:hypothetical protein